MNNQDKANLIKRITEIEGLTDAERSSLLGLLRENKTYGLVWEDKPEAIEEKLRDELPILTEVPDKAIISDDKEAPNHIIIEGDNLEALSTLAYTHAGKIDVIYIDPPYNTGNKDFIYNDSYVDKEDSYRHSKWLSFMSKRLKIAKQLLTDRGIVIISIDDNEQANLKILCDEIFGIENKVGVLPTIMNLKGNQDEFGFAGTHEYTIVYTKNISKAKINNFNIDDESITDWSEDEVGYYKKGANLKSTGVNAPSTKRPYLYYPILVNIETKQVSTILKSEYELIYNSIDKTFNTDYIKELEHVYINLGYAFLLPTTDGQEMSWRWGRDKVEKESHEIIVIGENGSYSLYKKQRPEIGDLPSKKPKSFFYKPEYSSGNGTAQLKNIFHEKTFNNPKPVNLICDFIHLGTQCDSIILDFFAGSGTTLHATMQLNAEDGGSRQCILVTNNENNICEEVTYERNKRVINGYTNPKGEEIAGLKKNNLHYYRTGFIGRSRSIQNMRKLVSLATDMLCIKENLYTEQAIFGEINTHKNIFRYFEDSDKKMLVIYREEAIDELVEAIYNIETENKIKVYVFSPSEDPWEGSFEDVSDKVELCALPHAIYNTYRRILPKKRDVLINASDDVLFQKEEEMLNNGELNFTE